jgi:outer membrane receptor protein involved in Fe transport
MEGGLFMKLTRSLCCSAAIVLPALFANGIAYAQQAETSDNGVLADVVVTAQKRVQNLQSVPISVTAISGDSLNAARITTLMQLNTVTPGLNVRADAGAFQPAIRGIGTSSTVVENPVALYIDGVYLPQQREGMRQLEDIEQVAILKGPQGTLFGRNATAGVIQITTKTPSHNFGVRAYAEVDNYATAKAAGYVTGGITDALAGSLSASYTTQERGWGKDPVNGRDTFKTLHEFTIRSKLLFEPGPDTRITLAGDYMNMRRLDNSRQPYQSLPLLAFPGTGPLGSVYDSYGGADSFNAFDGGGVSLTVNQDFSFAKFVSITSYRNGKGDYQFDNSSVPQPFFVVQSPSSPSRDFTQEIQLLSPDEGKLRWVLGAFYFHYSNAANPIIRNFGGIFTPAATSAAMTTTSATETTESVAPFGELNWELFSDTHLTLGARHTYERRTLDNGKVVTVQVGGAVVTSLFPKPPLVVREPTYRIALDHAFTDDILGYVSFNTGIKSGGFNTVSPANPSYLPEKLAASEIGLKSELFDRRVRLNIAAFNYDYTNLQVIQFVGLTQTVVNGPEANLYGLEVDAKAQITPALQASGGFTLEHSEFTNFNGAAFSIPKPAGGATIIPGNATGNRLPLAQKFSATAALDYHKELSAGALDFNVTGNYNGDFYFEADNFLRQRPYFLLNTSLKWTLPGDKFYLSAWGKNLLDEEVQTKAQTQTLGYPVTYGQAPLTFGVTAGASF